MALSIWPRILSAFTFMMCVMACSGTRLMEAEPLIEHVTIDELGHLYVQYEDDDLYAFSGSLDTLYQYYNQYNGKVTHVDVTNPFKILLFYRNQNMVVYLDNTLSHIEETSIDPQRYPDVEIVSTSRDDKLWVYEVTAQKIYKLNEDGSESFSGHPITDFTQSISSVDQLMERNNRLYLRSGDRLLIFDIYANFQRELQVPTHQDVFVIDDSILYVHKSGKIRRLEPPFYTPEEISIWSSIKPGASVVFSKNHSYIYTAQKVKRVNFQQ